MTLPRRRGDPVVLGVLVLLLALGTGLRLRHAATAYLDGDELHSLPTLDYPYQRVVRTFDYEGSGVALPLLQKLSVDIVGHSLLALRLPALVPSLLTLLLLPVLCWRLLGPGPALVATALLSVNGFHIFYSSFARSYGLVVLLALLVLWLAARMLDDAPASRRDVTALAVAAGLLPWAHLTSLPFVAAVLAALLVARWLAVGPRAVRPVLLASTGAAVVMAALYLPALKRVLEVAGLKAAERYEGAFDAIDVVGLLALGHRASGWALLALLVAAAAVVVRLEGVRRLPLLVGALAPIPLVFVVRPYGDAYAYARYAIPALPAMILLIGAASRHASGRWGTPRIWAMGALATALGLAALGPLRAIDDGPFAMSYLALEPLPAFDARYPQRPAAYAAIEPAASIIEAPALINRSRLLYRNYYLAAPRTTLMGFLPDEGPLPPGPHVAVRPSELAGKADYLFVHRDVEREADRYWRFVYQTAWPRVGGARALMERQAAFGRPLPRPEPSLLARLERRFGAPVFADEDVLVYRLR